MMTRALAAALLAFSSAASAFELAAWSTKVQGPKVSGHAAAVDASSGRVYAFGGLLDGAGSPVTEGLWSYDEGGGWKEEETPNGVRPNKRMYAAGAVLNSHLHLFGGWDPEDAGTGGTFKDDWWALDLKSREWKELGALPCGPVSRHTACTVGDQIVVQTFRSTVVCDGGKVYEQPTTGEAPLGFSMSAAAALGEHEMLVFGGSTKAQGMTADVYVLDTRTWHWRKLKPASGETPTPRGSACAASVDASTCVVYGGAGLGGGGYAGGMGLTPFDETWTVKVDGDEAVWTKLPLDDAPQARVAASLSPLPSGGFVMHGGWTPTTKETFDTSTVLKL